MLTWFALALAGGAAAVAVALELAKAGPTRGRAPGDLRLGSTSRGLARPPPAVRELRELVRYRAKLVALPNGLKAQVHAVLAKEDVRVPRPARHRHRPRRPRAR